MATSSFERGLFVLSLAVLSIVYGMAAQKWGWFPSQIANRAYEQAQASFTDNPFSYLVPRVYDHNGARRLGSGAMQPGVTLVSSMWMDEGEWAPEIRLLDSSGATIHKWAIREDLFAREGYVHGTHLRPSGDLLVNIEYVGTVRFDACGRVRWQLPKKTHHSIARAEDGSFWIPAQMGSPTTEYGGLDDPVVPEQILQVSPSGEVLERIDVTEVLLENDLERYFFKRHGPHPRGELMHVNDVEPLPAGMAASYPIFDPGDLLVSLRDLHLVFVFDPDTRDVKWHAFGPFIRQHDPDFMGDGRIGIFDNNPDGTHRGTVLGGSRIVVLRPPSDSMSVLYPTARSDSFYTEAAGKWQGLANGNLLLTEAQAGRVVEVSRDGAPVWEYVRTPRGHRVPEILDGTRYDLTAEDVNAWSCSVDDDDAP